MAMRVLVMGAGAVGSAYGAILAEHGHEVAYVARGAHLQALRERGLEVRRPAETIGPRPVTAVERPADAGQEWDLILFTVKGYDTEPAIEALRPVVGPRTTVLPLQNGVDGVDGLSAAFGRERVVAGTTTINVAVIEPGVIEERGVPIRTTMAELSGEITPRLRELEKVFGAAGLEGVASDDAQVALWRKFVLLAAHATITSACGEPVGAIRALPEGAALYRQLIDEAAAVGRAAGVALPPEIEDEIYTFVMTMAPTARSSMAIDFAAQKRVELEQITGAVVRRSKALSVPAPGFCALYPVLKVRALAYGGIKER
jgi:2-dehydropantoate 2-reductase